MIRMSLILLMVTATGCSTIGCSTVQAPIAARTLPEPVYDRGVPPEPERPEGGVSAIGVDSCVDLDGDVTGAGILFSDDTSQYVGRLRIGYDELRSLYIIDIRTRDQERAIYERALAEADAEVQRQHALAQRTWWEKHAGAMGLAGGILVGVAATIGVLAATQEVRSDP